MDGLPDERGAAERCARLWNAEGIPPPCRCTPEPAVKPLSHPNPGVPHPNTPAPGIPEPLPEPLSPSESRRPAPEYARPWHPRTPPRTPIPIRIQASRTRIRPPLASPNPSPNPYPHPNPGVPHPNTPAPGIPESLSPNPLVKPLFHPRTPARTRKTPPTTPRFAGPAPTSTTWIPDAVGQYPGGPRSEDDPCHGLRRLRTGGAFGSSIDTASVRQGQYPCAGSGGIFLSFRDSSPRSPAVEPRRPPPHPRRPWAGAALQRRRRRSTLGSPAPR